VATVPGLAFGDDGHVRLSYATGMPQIEAAMDRMERFLGHLA
jgi:aspartate aminotransferase